MSTYKYATKTPEVATIENAVYTTNTAKIETIENVVYMTAGDAILATQNVAYGQVPPGSDECYDYII